MGSRHRVPDRRSLVLQPDSQPLFPPGIRQSFDAAVGSSGLFALRPQDRLDRLLQGRKIPFHHCPDRLPVHVEVAVDERVAHRDNLPPRCQRIFLAKILGNARHRLADDLDVVQALRADQFVAVEALATWTRLPLDGGDGLEDVPKPVGILPHKTTAS